MKKLLLALLLASLVQNGFSEDKTILFLAGKSSHKTGVHQHIAGCQFLADCIKRSGLNIKTVVLDHPQWGKISSLDPKPDAIVIYSDGFKRHPVAKHKDAIQALVDLGAGIACFHFAVEVEPDKLGSTFLEWMGGYFEIGWSVNPSWKADFDKFPNHPVCNGVKPFSLYDEWYYHMRFVENKEGVTPILSALPPKKTLNFRPKNPKRSNNPTVINAVKNGEKQAVSWIYQRPDGGRGFGLTGGHLHKNWQNDNFRKIVLNALVWISRIEVPAYGVSSGTPTNEELEVYINNGHKNR